MTFFLEWFGKRQLEEGENLENERGDDVTSDHEEYTTDDSSNEGTEDPTGEAETDSKGSTIPYKGEEEWSSETDGQQSAEGGRTRRPPTYFQEYEYELR